MDLYFKQKIGKIYSRSRNRAIFCHNPAFFRCRIFAGIPTLAILKNPITIIKFIKFFYLGTMKKYTRLQIYKERKN